MIPRSNLAEQLREYQIRSKYEWTPFSFSSFSSSNLTSRVDFIISAVWELMILAFLVLSAVSLYFRERNGYRNYKHELKDQQNHFNIPIDASHR
ncbi:hypothetical protein MRB53_014452 [Persea americana]|uniref:Uncharacterized protein n=1 Tax=Persea americana TaxID=3435 RepID=A0ACC2KB01_PERAE|nr:hypothetical protein MRB53_014452 [Persea americana]